MATSGTYKSKSFLNFPLVWKEKRLVRAQCNSLLKIFAIVKNNYPTMNDYNLYVHFVKRALRIQEAMAKEIVQRAEESYASWPTERDVKLHDVIHYIIVIEYMRKNKLGGLGPHFKEVVDEVVPYHL